jgi:uncharacterized repeat protein (TIGR01451 family)
MFMTPTRRWTPQRWLTGLGALAITATALTGCKTTGSDTVADGGEKAPMKAKPTTLPPMTLAYPTGDPSTSAITMQKTLPAEVRVGEEFTYTLKLTNLTNDTLHGLKVTEPIPADMKLVKASPEPASSEDGTAVWTMEGLAPNQSAMISVTAVASKPGSLRQCATVSYEPRLCSSLVVVAPELLLSVTGPETGVVCDPIEAIYTVSNTGSGTAPAVVIKETLPEGLKLQGAGNELTINVGDLPGGESKRFRVRLEADKAGSYTYGGTATGGSLSSEAKDATTALSQPVLAVKASAPERRFFGQEFSHEFTVTNTGDAAAAETVLTASLPANAQVVRVSDGGQTTERAVIWSLNELAPEASKTVSVTFSAAEAGEVATTVDASAKCAESVSSAARTNLSGVAALLLEVVDVSDPVAVGDETVYVITVTNQGSAPDTNIKVSATLEDEIGYVSATGSTSVTADGNNLTFAPVASLAPKAQVSWRITVKAQAEGDVRFGVKMKSDTLGRSVDETESTNFYK